MRNYLSTHLSELTTSKGRPVLFVMLLLLGVAIAYPIQQYGELAAIIAMGIIVSVPMVYLCFVYPHAGFLLMFIISSFIFLAKRFVDAPFGIIPEAITLLIAIGLLFQKRGRFPSLNLREPVTIAVVVWVVYMLIQVFNPNATSFQGWIFGIRNIISLLLVYLILNKLFDSIHFVNLFTKVWLTIALLAAIYGLYQEFVGLPDFDKAWVTSSDQLIGLNFIQGRWRKWSFLSDCTAFGMFMAISSICCFILLTGPYRIKIKVLLLVSGLLMLLAMVYSGTRTAYAMIPAGFFLYGLLTLNQTKTIIAGGIIILVMGSVFLVPTQNKLVNRVKSTFLPSEDASMNVRDVNRARIQPYIYEHPIGGGLTTTGAEGVRFSPNHPLAAFPPDNGYLKIALETGWVGLLLYFSLFFIVITTGIHHLMQVKNSHIQVLYLVYICIFFALTVANFTQTSINQLPYGFVMYGCFVLMHRLIMFDREDESIIVDKK